MLLQQIRDEAHRFAINFNRSSRSKAMKKNILEELPGFGPVTRKKLLKLAGSVDGIRELPLDAIESICTKPQIEILQSHGLLDIDK
jgi:excinuclease ABC subunit C